MKLTTFEKETLKKIIPERIELSKIDKMTISTQLKKAFSSILEKIDSEKFTLNKAETYSLIKLFNEQYDLIKKHTENWNLIKWINISHEIKNELLYNDVLVDLIKGNKRYADNHKGLKPRIDENIRYRNIFTVIQKLKNSEDIYLSKIENPYKICFIYNNQEHCIFELKDEYKIYNICFYKNSNFVRDICESQITRAQALELLTNCNPNIYDKNLIDFLIEVLK